MYTQARVLRRLGSASQVARRQSVQGLAEVDEARRHWPRPPFSLHTAGVEPRDRFLGPIAGETGGDPESPATVDFGNLVRKLVLFDEIIVESHNLKEPAPIAQKFGYDGAKALLESGRIRLVNDMVWVADIGQAPRPNRPMLPLGSYSINAARLTPPRDFLSRQLHKVDAVPGLTAKQAQKLRQLAGSRVVSNPEEAPRLAQDQISRDFEANLPLLKMSISSAFAVKWVYLELELAPQLRLERLSGQDWHTETNLDKITNLTTKQIHDAVGQGLAAASILNVRVALMHGFTALSGFQVNDLPLFEEKLEFVAREFDPDVQLTRFDRVREIVGLPDVSNDLAVRDVDMAKLIEITSGQEVHDFRQWLRASDSLTDKDMEDLVHPVRDALAQAIRTPAAKAVRLATTAGVGVLFPPAGVGLSVLDTFLVDKVMPRPGPTAFLSRLSRSIFNS